ncbi:MULTISPECIES: DUF4309 domain-containing protein [unclassified Paenibacillus]|uniref:DUF4309 domain-containing protein n=1 Tax=unclassified Paenibacillus TaxID=185978 RepID=UPI001AE8D156|nr:MULTISPECIES: DUF4309 domain-containing protein [unclassified Paenibacillus]MBP1154817.1 hypothetical protein [Paenibacillus sp. PvP091]MBP1169799.1 hypothetical protein [Paenibacillus sp. PvR098]MBP2440827.1 hypothetical protein [Paenibacillus sp. PvP052]
MNRKQSFIGFLSVMIVITLIAAGCKKDQAGPSDIPQETTQEPVVSVTPAPSVDEAEPPQLPVTDPAAVETPISPPPSDPNEQVSLASADKGTNGEDPKTGANSKPKIKIESPYTVANPTLLGFTLKTSAEEVISKIGKPREQFVMDDDADPITVYDYTDFLMGFNKNNQLHFIDVRSADINPGLGGLKLGDPVADVSKALGKPDVNTNFVLTYKATGAMLKLDIDPNTQTVNSIKLFAE